MPSPSAVRRSRALALASMLAPLAGCSWIVDTSTVQCRTSADCAAYGAAVCQAETRVCVALTSADAAVGPDGATDAPADAAAADAGTPSGPDAGGVEARPADAAPASPDLGTDLVPADSAPD